MKKSKKDQKGKRPKGTDRLYKDRTSTPETSVNVNVKVLTSR